MARREKPVFLNDPQWYKDAVIYQVHVKSFYDANNDGIGDFAGLIEKLDYIADLGVNTLWLLPFYPSPRRDDGYDIAQYRGVHSDYGSLADARRFIAEAHRRGLRVITELVINHTSDQHPWFIRARHAKKGSRARDYYVWSDSDEKYQGTRIIFIDTEQSNWTWDPVAQQYYWHRFYSHQPDLNFDNPQVLREVLGVMRYWLDMGVDGLRLDAIPYLIERDGTSSENLPETHQVLKRIRAEAGRALSRPHAAGRGQPVAGRHPAVLRRRGWRRGRRMPHGLPLPADAAHVHGHRPGGSLSDHRHPAPDPGHPGQLPMGDLPAQPRRADPGDGHRRRARLSLEPLCRRPPRAPQPGHPPAPGAAGGA